MSERFHDFLPASYHAARLDRRILRGGLVLLAVIAVATAGAFAVAVRGLDHAVRQRDVVESSWLSAERHVDDYLAAQLQLRASVAEAGAISEQLDMVPRSMLLTEVVRLLPTEVVLREFHVQARRRVNEEDELLVREHIRVVGIASTDGVVSRYIDSLVKSPLFKHVSLQHSTQDSDDDVRSFAIQMEVGEMATMFSEVEQ